MMQHMKMMASAIRSNKTAALMALSIDIFIGLVAGIVTYIFLCSGCTI